MRVSDTEPNATSTPPARVLTPRRRPRHRRQGATLCAVSFTSRDCGLRLRQRGISSLFSTAPREQWPAGGSAAPGPHVRVGAMGAMYVPARGCNTQRAGNALYVIDPMRLGTTGGRCARRTMRRRRLVSTAVYSHARVCNDSVAYRAIKCFCNGGSDIDLAVWSRWRVAARGIVIDLNRVDADIVERPACHRDTTPTSAATSVCWRLAPTHPIKDSSGRRLGLSGLEPRRTCGNQLPRSRACNPSGVDRKARPRGRPSRRPRPTFSIRTQWR